MKALLVPALLLAACTDGTGAATPDSGAAGGADAAGGGGKPVVVLATTAGELVVELEPTLMPITTANFLSYVDGGWYDGTIIHRVIDDWVIQGGGYTTGLQPKAPMAPIELETNDALSHVHGAISMARTSDPDSATSQWFIVDWPASGTPPQPGQLDGNYAAFGVLIDGFDVLEMITQAPTQNAGGLEDVPVSEIIVTSAYRR